MKGLLYPPSGLTVVLLLLLLFLAIVAIIYLTQALAESNLRLELAPAAQSEEALRQAKLAAEIKQIRSDTSGSLFWLKLFALFVTVGGAVAGYLYGLTTTAQKQAAADAARIEADRRQANQRIDFERRREVDALYQSLVKELSDASPLLRAAAAVKLGALLDSFPPEWHVTPERREQLIRLTKQVLAACLSIEKEEKVLKTLTIALVLHRRWRDDPDKPELKEHADARNLDLSWAKAFDAYWARADFSGGEFYKANLGRASFRRSILHHAQFREAVLKDAVLAGADCRGANFKLCDLRGADLTGAQLAGAIFEGARVHGARLAGADLSGLEETSVNVAPGDDDKPLHQSLGEWFAQQSAAAPS
jgi:hypothetical protein